MKCPHCQEEHPAGTKICPNTGLPIEGNQNKSQTNQKGSLRILLSVLVIAVVAVGGYLLADHYGLFSAASDNSTAENSATGEDSLADDGAESAAEETESTSTVDMADAPEEIASVNGVAISTSDFQRRVRWNRDQMISEYFMYYQIANTLTDSTQKEQYLSYLNYLEAMMEQDAMGNGMINQMIDELFIVEEAQARGITVTDQEVDDYYYGLFGYYPNGTASTDGTDSAAEPLPTSVTEEEFNASNSTYLEGLKKYDVDEAFIRDLVRVTLYRDKLIADLETDVVTEEEQVWARHILLEDEATALDVLDQLENGADFGEMAVEYSIGPSAPSGGDLGWFGRGVMVPAFEDAAFSGEVGDIIGPVQTEFGYHLIQIMGKEMRPVDEATANSLATSALSGLLDDYLAGADIVYADNWIQYTPTDPSISDVLGGN